MVAGLQVPVMPLVDEAGSRGGAVFWQSGPMGLNVGVMPVVMVTESVVVVAQSPGVGVKVYTVVPTVDVLIVAGLQVPVIPFVEVAGSNGAAAF